MRTLRGLGWPPMQRPFISSIAVAASDVLENLMYVTPASTEKESINLVGLGTCYGSFKLISGSMLTLDR